MNTARLAAWRAQYEADALEVKQLADEAIASKAYGDYADIEGRLDRLAQDKDRLDTAERNAKSIAAMSARLGGYTEAGGEGGQPSPLVTKAATGREVSPLAISKAALEALHQAAVSRQTPCVKGFSSVGSLLPAQLAPDVLGKVHESRLLDRLPTQSITAPAYEILVHSSTTGAPAPTAEGAVKPEVVLNTTSQTLTAVKIAAHFGISYESLNDFPAFAEYAQVEMLRQLQDVENAQLISGSGTSGNMTGFLSTSGILTHDARMV